MRVLADISLVPMGVGLSVSKYVAECEKIGIISCYPPIPA